MGGGGNGNSKNIHHSIYTKFIQQFPKDKSVVLYVGRKNNPFKPDSRIRNHSFNLLDESFFLKIKKELNKCYKEVEEKGKSLLLIFDWGGLMKEYDTISQEFFLAFIESILKKTRGLAPPGWKRKYKTVQKKYPILIINAFIPDKLETDFINELMSLHKRIYLFQENYSLLSIPGVSLPYNTIFPEKYALSSETLEKLAKDNLEIICLALLEKGNQSGYQMLKNVANHFHCIISQGTLYPLLYSLEKEGKIMSSNGKGRTRVYSISPKGRKEIENKKQQLISGYQHLTGLF